MVLSGPNNYAGGTTLAGGTLSISANNNIGTGPLAMLNGTTLQLNSFFLNFTHPTSIAGDATVNVPTINGAIMSAPITDGAAPGQLVKTGTGTLVLTAENTYTGGTFVDRGTLQIGNGGTTGSIVGNVLNDANFAINRSDVFTFVGLISGAGGFEQAGSGTTIFTANNTYTGNTVISGGTLQLGDGGTTGAIASSVVTNFGTLAFNRSNTYDFGGVISGIGAVQQNGTGTTIFGGTHGYTGATTVNAGTLIVNGSIVSSSGVTVNAGGTLGGTGKLPATTINGGNLSPGNSIGTISVNGSLSFVGPGNYIVEVSPSAADKTNVTGAPGTRRARRNAERNRNRGRIHRRHQVHCAQRDGRRLRHVRQSRDLRQLRRHQAAHRIRRQQRLSGARSQRDFTVPCRRDAQPARRRRRRRRRDRGGQPVGAVRCAVQSHRRAASRRARSIVRRGACQHSRRAGG